eukprot:c15384_g1_i1.p1 GENE.c15384_g1_i1~~c15384_g1_i1.p1  ORF type:complete len:285 (+),score=80.14 c15384_g1_i1:48-857(+)
MKLILICLVVSFLILGVLSDDRCCQSSNCPSCNTMGPDSVKCWCPSGGNLNRISCVNGIMERCHCGGVHQTCPSYVNSTIPVPTTNERQNPSALTPEVEVPVSQKKELSGPGNNCLTEKYKFSPENQIPQNRSLVGKEIISTRTPHDVNCSDSGSISTGSIVYCTVYSTCWTRVSIAASSDSTKMFVCCTNTLGLASILDKSDFSGCSSDCSNTGFNFNWESDGVCLWEHSNPYGLAVVVYNGNFVNDMNYQLQVNMTVITNSLECEFP